MASFDNASRYFQEKCQGNDTTTNASGWSLYFHYDYFIFTHFSQGGFFRCLDFFMVLNPYMKACLSSQGEAIGFR